MGIFLSYPTNLYHLILTLTTLFSIYFWGININFTWQDLQDYNVLNAESIENQKSVLPQ